MPRKRAAPKPAQPSAPLAEEQADGDPLCALADIAETVPLPERLLWDLPEVAHVLGVSEKTMKRMAAANELPAGTIVRIGRRRLFARKVIEEWVARGAPVIRAATRKQRSAR
ncbi:MAG: helix-turn-helix domain-containing protein [Gemmataceae bacterium]|nr:helix-turn-helix domain-containing protein [Gemmataceae bacterium]